MAMLLTPVSYTHLAVQLLLQPILTVHIAGHDEGCLLYTSCVYLQMEQVRSLEPVSVVVGSVVIVQSSKVWLPCLLYTSNLTPLDFLRLHGRLYRFGCDGIFQGRVAAVSVLYHPCGKAYGDRLGALAAREVIVHTIRQGDRKLMHMRFCKGHGVDHTNIGCLRCV